MNPGVALVSRGRLFGGGETPLSRGVITIGTSVAPVVVKHFFFDSVAIVSPLIIRARFSSPPKTGSGPIAQRGDFASNWKLISPTGQPLQVRVATNFLHDPEVIDLHLISPLNRGVHKLSVASTILDVFGNSLSAQFRF